MNTKIIVYGITIFIIVSVIGFAVYSVHSSGAGGGGGDGGGGGGDTQCERGNDGKCPNGLVCDWKNTGKCVSAEGGKCNNSNDCNNGKCGSNKKCICTSPYIGEFCNEICKSGDNTCKNGAKCSSDNKKCICKTGFSGLLCENKDSECNKDNCKNGTCQDDGTCKCNCDSDLGCWENDQTDPNNFCTACAGLENGNGNYWGPSPKDGCNRVFYNANTTIAGTPYDCGTGGCHDRDCAHNFNGVDNSVNNAIVVGTWGKSSCQNNIGGFKSQINCKGKNGLWAYKEADFACAADFGIEGIDKNPNNLKQGKSCRNSKLTHEKTWKGTAWKCRAGLSFALKDCATDPTCNR